MTFDDACQALRSHLQTGLTTVPLQWSNEAPPSTPWPPKDANSNPTPWAYCEFRGGSGEQISIGAPDENDHEEVGALVAYVHTALKGGDARSRQICDSIIGLFRGKDIGGVEITGTLRDEGDENAERSHWLRTARIEFRFDDVG